MLKQQFYKENIIEFLRENETSYASSGVEPQFENVSC